MLKEAKRALRITTDVYDDEIAALIRAGASDLELAGIVIPPGKRTSANPEGKISKGISLKIGVNSGIVDKSELADELIERAILTYVRIHFGSPNDYDRLKTAYDEQKAQMQTATGYTTGYPFTGTEDA